jgi:CO dehydrogenase/acetyl-CoA synthase delta subunit
LAWESPADNNRRKVEHGTQTRGAEHPGAVLDDDRVVRIRERAATGETYVSISADVGTSNSLVARICKGKTWKHAGGPVQGYRHPSWEAA